MWWLQRQHFYTLTMPSIHIIIFLEISICVEDLGLNTFNNFVLKLTDNYVVLFNACMFNGFILSYAI